MGKIETDMEHGIKYRCKACSRLQFVPISEADLQKEMDKSKETKTLLGYAFSHLMYVVGPQGKHPNPHDCMNGELGILEPVGVSRRLKT